MKKCFVNRYAGECWVTKKAVGPEEGYAAINPATGAWGVLTAEAAKAAGYVLVGKGAGVDHKNKGVSMGLSVADTWARLFKDNETRTPKPWTDEQISQFMLSEFPGSSEESRSVARVRMYRGSYNAGAHSFSGRGIPAVLSHEYDAAGNKIENKIRAPRAGSAVDEARIREIAMAAIKGMELKVDGEAVRKIVREELTRSQPPVVSISVGGLKAKKVDSKGKHAKFVDVLKRVEAEVPVLLVGPAGCGKTHLAEQVAAALGLPFSFNSMSDGVSEAHLLGRTLPGKGGAWEYAPSPFVKAYTEGGLHLLDEIDAADPNLLVSVNAAIANGFLSVPTAGPKPMKRHKNCVILAAANTYGTGADRQYVGRNQLDAATTDRFRMGTVEMDYDRDLERSLIRSVDGVSEAAAAALLEWGWRVRDRINSTRLRRIMSTRVLIDSAKLLAVGLTMADVSRTFLAGWTADELGKVA